MEDGPNKSGVGESEEQRKPAEKKGGKEVRAVELGGRIVAWAHHELPTPPLVAGGVTKGNEKT